MTPEEFYRLDPELQKAAGRMAEAFIEAHFVIAAEDVIEDAKTRPVQSAKKARKPRKHPAFNTFMARVVEPGALMSGRHKIDVMRLPEDPNLLIPMDNVENSWLRWLEIAPRAAEDPNQACSDFINEFRGK